ncbi:hypothetical protein Ancab_024944 [Ancistrocladus abbreviatus]
MGQWLAFLETLFPQVWESLVTIYNFQLYRHVEWPPGWSLSWRWPHHEVINHIAGAEAKEQGVCNETLGGQRPHCCLKNPVIIDLIIGAPYNKRVANCCKGGVLASMTQDPSKAVAAFQMNVGNAGGNALNFWMPTRFRFGSPGYSCGDPEFVDPTKFPDDGGRRWTQAQKTFKVICTFSQFQASPAPTCCVSLSAFYSPDIIKCPSCSCACWKQPAPKCIEQGEIRPRLQKPKDPDTEPPVVWNLAVKHPNLRGVVQVFSFNYRPLNRDGTFNDTGLFWGIQYYNDMLLQSGDSGNVQSEMLLRKDLGHFTFSGGWAFPRRIYFDGQECVMPSPVDFPRLPSERNLAP